ncbi:MAG: enoyl-CoA hydratase [Pseudomonadota bacterium]|jgi:enoyl-CoA hydratase|nr:enoyl-CoA hydratase [Pseudomonadota bacterium]MEC7138976.1 enoyl-CoA hydratase [Pseudomonadota bacterium]MEC7380286.1 enoyl-CoA hydratase [Pseudomonadota bacterium]MEC7413623.1 enoyl-CoA hydratase [Pseudomonadota bacterium]MEC7420558.1 enoyl-CoA hydratase [Pseudomonadota bacterium]|tara:strand:- start:167 stop:1003 length:837 start_codon:yes stop_codon:yes gene_type:complete
MSEFSRITYEVSEGVARIALNRVEVRNAQDKAMLYELNDAFDLASRDDEVKVIVLAANGPHFSSGHDLADRTDVTEFSQVSNWGGYDKPGAEGRQALEEEIYLGLCWRWRNLPKPTIAEVQGKVIAGGLMLVWVCDLIVAAEDTTFSDPVVAFGVNGVEYFAHPWEFGARKAKELLFTGGRMTAQEALSCGMVNHVVARADLTTFTSDLAARIAQRPSMGLRLAKQSVNQALDAQGFYTALQAAMSLQQLGHANNEIVHGRAVDPAGAEVIKREAKLP